MSAVEVHGPVSHGVECFERWRQGRRCPHEVEAEVCVECWEPIEPPASPHAAHEPDCPVDPRSEEWDCGCDVFAHARCCRACAPTLLEPT